jgi:hypothetical protein
VDGGRCFGLGGRERFGILTEKPVAKATLIAGLRPGALKAPAPSALYPTSLKARAPSGTFQEA